MNAKRLFAVCLAIVMACALIALVACDEHQHSYTKWDHNESQHWKVCPDDGAVDESSKASHSVGTSGKCECGYEPQTQHQHNYTKWDHDDSQHWKVCPDDNAIDESSREPHSVGTNGKCECGYEEQVTPQPQLDTREFYVVGGGQGDLKNGSWSECKSAFKFNKTTEADENGKTVYTFTMTMYSDDNFKVILPDTISKGSDGSDQWDDAKVLSFANLDGTAKANFKDINGNITLDQGKDGEYRFTIRTTKDMALASVKLEVELVQSIPGIGVKDKYEMYIVGTVASHPTCNWPGSIGLDNVPSRCIKMELQEDNETFSVTVTLATSDEFKLWNYKEHNASSGYYPTGAGGNLKVKTAGEYVVSWKVGDTTATITLAPHVHKYTEWGFDADGHWKQCPGDGVVDESTRATHTFVEGECECGAKQETQQCAHESYDAVFKYTQDTVPAPNANGGKLTKVCSNCGATVGEVSYDAGFNGGGDSAPTRVHKLKGVGSYYAHLDDEASAANGINFGFGITQPGTYTISIENVFVTENVVLQLRTLGFLNDSAKTLDTKADSAWWTPSGPLGSRGVVWQSNWKTSTATKEKYSVEVDGMNDFTDTANPKYVQLKSITFVVTQEQITGSKVTVDGKKAVAVLLAIASMDTSDNSYPTYRGDFMLTISKATTEAPAAIATSNVQQHALLPTKH